MGASQPTGRPAQAAPSVLQASSNGAQLGLAASQQRSIKGKACLTRYSTCNVDPLATSHCPLRPVFEAQNDRLASSTAVSLSSCLVFGVPPCQNTCVLPDSTSTLVPLASGLNLLLTFLRPAPRSPLEHLRDCFPFYFTSGSPFRLWLFSRSVQPGFHLHFTFPSFHASLHIADFMSSALAVGTPTPFASPVSSNAPSLPSVPPSDIPSPSGVNTVSLLR